MKPSTNKQDRIDYGGLGERRSGVQRLYVTQLSMLLQGIEVQNWQCPTITYNQPIREQTTHNYKQAISITS